MSTSTWVPASGMEHDEIEHVHERPTFTLTEQSAVVSSHQEDLESFLRRCGLYGEEAVVVLLRLKDSGVNTMHDLLSSSGGTAVFATALTATLDGVSFKSVQRSDSTP